MRINLWTLTHTHSYTYTIPGGHKDKDYYSSSYIKSIIHQASQRLTNVLMNKCIVKSQIQEYQIQLYESSTCPFSTRIGEGSLTVGSSRRQHHLHSVCKISKEKRLMTRCWLRSRPPSATTSAVPLSSSVSEIVVGEHPDVQ